MYRKLILDMLLKLQLSIVMGLETTVKAFHAVLVSQAKPYQKQLHYSEFLLILNMNLHFIPTLPKVQIKIPCSNIRSSILVVFCILKMFTGLDLIDLSP